jgi:hypothetical protein
MASRTAGGTAVDVSKAVSSSTVIICVRSARVRGRGEGRECS